MSYIVENTLFKLDEIPTLHPASQKYVEFWKEQKRRCIEGHWESGKWMPGKLYFYINFGTIKLNKEGGSKVKYYGRPWLRDLEWEFFLNWTEARGFSGFELDDNYTCFQDVKKLEQDTNQPSEYIKRYYPSAIKPDGTLKKYVAPREYLRKIHPTNMGRPLYDNQAKNLFMMGARGYGKSYSVGVGIVLHEWLFDGKHIYDPEAPITASEIVMGAGDAKYSSETLSKTKIGLEQLPGALELGGIYYPSPFAKQYSGSWAPGKEIIAQYKKKVGGNWVIHGTKSNIKHRTFKDNPFAANGTRPGVLIFEEVGMFDNLKEAYNASVECQRDGAYKFGSMMFLGCVCAGTKVYNNFGQVIPIELLRQEEGIIGYDGHDSRFQSIAHLNPPQKKECVRITTSNNNVIECSIDHPLLMSNIRWANGKKATFKRADKIKLGDQLHMAGSVPVFGTKTEKDAYLLGYSVGDGYFYKDGGIELAVMEPELQKYFEENYNLSLKKHNPKTGFKSYYVKGIAKLTKRLELSGKSKLEKTFPINIHEFNRESVARFIEGYYDADGNVSLKKGKYISIVLTSASEKLLEQMKYLLLKFGIHSSLAKEFRKSGYASESTIYRLYISKYEDALKFKENFTLKCNRKQKLLDTIEQYRPTRLIGRKKTSFVNTYKGEYFEEKELDNTKTVVVKSIERLGLQNVYNLNASDTHTYYANGFITHNTGGDMNGGGTVDAQEMFYNPASYDCVEFEDAWEYRGKVGYFVPAYLGLNQYKNIVKGVQLSETDEPSAKKDLEKQRNKLRNTGGSLSALEGEIINRPLVPSEIFLQKQGNIFPVAELRRRLSELESFDRFSALEKKVELYFDPKCTEYNGVNYRLDTRNELIAINTFPWKETHKEGCVVIYEFPELIDGRVPEGAYIIGHDPYASDDPNGDSLAATVVMKTKKYFDKIGHDEIVAMYVGRPYQGRHIINENLYKLSKFYGDAKIYFENVRGNVKEYFEKIKRLDLLAKQPQTVLSKKASYENTSPVIIYGYPMSNKAIKMEALQYVRDWLLEERVNAQGEVIRNLDRLWDRALLKELIAFNMEGNFDRCMALIGCVIGMQETYNQYQHRAEQSIKMNELKTFLSENKFLFNY